MDKSQGTNNVDVSEERIEREISQLAIDEDLENNAINDKSESFEDAQFNDVESEGLSEIDQEKATESLGGILSFAMLYGFTLLKPNWNILENEAENMGAAWSKVIIKYLPFQWLRFIPNIGGGESVCLECDAVMITFKVISPRLEKSEQSEIKTEIVPNVQPIDNNAMVDVHGS